MNVAISDPNTASRYESKYHEQPITGLITFPSEKFGWFSNEWSTGAAKPRTVLTKEQAIEIFRLLSPGRSKPTAVSIAKHFGVSEKAIRDIWNGRTWHEATLPWDSNRRPKIALKTGRPLGRKDRAPRRRKTVGIKSPAKSDFEERDIHDNFKNDGSSHQLGTNDITDTPRTGEFKVLVGNVKESRQDVPYQPIFEPTSAFQQMFGYDCNYHQPRRCLELTRTTNNLAAGKHDSELHNLNFFPSPKILAPPLPAPPLPKPLLPPTPAPLLPITQTCLSLPHLINIPNFASAGDRAAVISALKPVISALQLGAGTAGFSLSAWRPHDSTAPAALRWPRPIPSADNLQMLPVLPQSFAVRGPGRILSTTYFASDISGDSPRLLPSSSPGVGR